MSKTYRQPIKYDRKRIRRQLQVTGKRAFLNSCI